MFCVVFQVCAFRDSPQLRREYLTKQVELCRQRLERASKLMGGLSGEEERWVQALKQLGVDGTNLVGDALLASCSIAYLGPFTKEFRDSLLQSWRKVLGDCGLPFAPGSSLTTIKSDPVLVGSLQTVISV